MRFKNINRTLLVARSQVRMGYSTPIWKKGFPGGSGHPDLHVIRKEGLVFGPLIFVGQGIAAGPPVMRDPPGVLCKIWGRWILIRARNELRSGKVVQRGLYWGRIGDGVKRENKVVRDGVMRVISG